MSNAAGSKKVFLFLQGPHGPFFYRLGQMLRHTQAKVWRVGFNAGDRAFWFGAPNYIPYLGKLEDWPATFGRMVEEKQVTDLVLYGDTRAVHSYAIEIARARGLMIHVFEEGYMRPYWVTYERGGSNGHSRLMHMAVADMQEALKQSDMEAPLPPGHWGDTRQHVVYGALYHWFVMFFNRRYRHFQTHRELPVTMEFYLYLKQLILMPTHALQRAVRTLRIRRGGFPYHLCLLQLEHDASFLEHSPFTSMSEFLELVVEAFAKGAPGHHHLVFKAHPLDNGRTNLRSVLKGLSVKHGVKERVHYVRGGKLAPLLNDARTAVTVNSTSGQQVLWRGIPLRVFGKAVYAKSEFVSTQPLTEFFDAPRRPDNRAYKDYRRYLLETSQVPGGYYSAKGRRQLLRLVVDMMLSPDDPYDGFASGTATPRKQLSLVF